MASGLAIVLVGLMLGAFDYANSPYVTAVGWVGDQPVPFSHKHHVADDGIDCRYCHTGVETSPNAGLPPTHTCMTCHSQLWTDAGVLAPVRHSYASGEPIRWQRVAQLPDYVYFDHSIHVNRGVACVECHGRIDRMPLTSRAEPFQMQFCLECHRDPAGRLRPPDQVTRMEPLGWTEAEARRFGEGVIAAHHINTKTLDNCGICHR
ncbi:cytochrome c [Altererythrobacter sp. B11]|uniref:cytochrome c3 family protein n=1 Tax=Altererythrobacter sp. B11 TaxID=2060312 RepID=UPI000DC712FF|nr:cytochrome c3 family protein [Altererythrobacter sp. B11]BBC72769.1 cytochrome c [Altererythrobacter sp. B11]